MGFVRSPRGFYPTVVECRLEKIAVEAAGHPRPKMLLVKAPNTYSRSAARRWLTMRNGPCGERPDLAHACQAC
jgi:hypothetical protein